MTVCSSHAQGVHINFMGSVAGAFVLHSSYVFCLPSLLAIVECQFAPTPPTLSCLHRVTSVSMGVVDSLRVAMDTCTLGLYHVWLQLTEGTFPKLI